MCKPLIVLVPYNPLEAARLYDIEARLNRYGIILDWSEWDKRA